VNKRLEKKLAELPKEAGVYLYKDAAGQIIYVGKAAVLKNRVRQYFQTSRYHDPKTDALVAEIANLDWITVESEIDALFLEAELVRRYLPRYNILLRDDKSSLYVRIDYDNSHPTVTFTHRPLDDGAKYFGPYFNAVAVKRALKYLRKIFPYSTHTTVPKRACLLYHLGLCPGLEEGKISLQDYRASLRKLMQYLKGERVKLIRETEREMKAYAKTSAFEDAAHARNQLFALKGLSKQIIFSDKEFMDLSRDEGLAGLAELLGLHKPPRRIEGFDISHMSGTDNVASMVVFSNGLPDKANYRKFKMRLPGNDDFAHMNEAITRRLSEKNRKAWGLPDLFLIDGGKGQLDAAIAARDEVDLGIPMIGLAKREEEIIVKLPQKQESRSKNQGDSGVVIDESKVQEAAGFITKTDNFASILLPKSSHVVKLLQRIRDESHRFAVSYHSVLKTKRQTASLLDDIPGIGPITRKKLLKTFGSMRGITGASQSDIAKAIGPQKAKLLAGFLRPTN
jgi:excinuclease ABC subunit C